MKRPYNFGMAGVQLKELLPFLGDASYRLASSEEDRELSSITGDYYS